MAALTIVFPPSTIAPGEPNINLRAVDTFIVEGVQAHPGDTFTPPLRLGLGIVGIGSAIQTP